MDPARAAEGHVVVAEAQLGADERDELVQACYEFGAATEVEPLGVRAERDASAGGEPERKLRWGLAGSGCGCDVERRAATARTFIPHLLGEEQQSIRLV